MSSGLFNSVAPNNLEASLALFSIIGVAFVVYRLTRGSDEKHKKKDGGGGGSTGCGGCTSGCGGCGS